MTLEQICLQYGLEPEAAIQALQAEGITAEPDMTMRQIADQHNLHPSRLREILLPNG